MPTKGLQYIRTTDQFVAQELGDSLGAIAPFDIYGDAYDALWQGYFDPLCAYQRWGDLPVWSSWKVPQG